MSKQKCWIGIDPGLKGAIAVLMHSCGPEVADMPVEKVSASRKRINAGMLAAEICDLRDSYSVALVAVEQLGVRPKNSALSSATTGAGWGMIIGVLAALRVPYVIVRPQEWQGLVLAGQPGEKKNKALLYAENRWPNVELSTPRDRVLDGRADALCIAESARRISATGVA